MGKKLTDEEVRVRVELGNLVREVRAALALLRDAFAKKVSSESNPLTGKSIQHYEEKTRTPELLRLIQMILAAPEPFRSRMAKYIPGEVWLLASRLETRQLRILDTPVIIAGDPREGFAPSPQSADGFDQQAAIFKVTSGNTYRGKKKAKQLNSSKVAER